MEFIEKAQKLYTNSWKLGNVQTGVDMCDPSLQKATELGYISVIFQAKVSANSVYISEDKKKKKKAMQEGADMHSLWHSRHLKRPKTANNKIWNSVEVPSDLRDHDEKQLTWAAQQRVRCGHLPLQIRRTFFWFKNLLSKVSKAFILMTIPKRNIRS